MLSNPNSTERERLAGLLGLHIKFWHAPEYELRRLLYRGGQGKDVIALLPKVIELCTECAAVQATMHKPLVKAAIAEHFNQRVQTDLLFIWDKCFMILVDECLASAPSA